MMDEALVDVFEDEECRAVAIQVLQAGAQVRTLRQTCPSEVDAVKSLGDDADRVREELGEARQSMSIHCLSLVDEIRETCDSLDVLVDSVCSSLAEQAAIAQSAYQRIKRIEVESQRQVENHLQEAMNDFSRKFRQLCSVSKQGIFGTPIPYWIKECYEKDPELKDHNEHDNSQVTEYRNVKEICALCGWIIQVQHNGQGLSRIHCLDCFNISHCQVCWNILESIFNALDLSIYDLCKEDYWENLRNSNSEIWEVVDSLCTFDQHIRHINVWETNSSNVMRQRFFPLQFNKKKRKFQLEQKESFGVEDLRLVEIIHEMFSEYANRPCFGNVRFLDSGQRYYHWKTFGEIRSSVYRFAYGMRKIMPQHSLAAICSENRYDWYIADASCIMNGITSVGIHSKWNNEDFLYVLEQTRCQSLIVDLESLRKFEDVIESYNGLLGIIIVMDIQNTVNEEDFSCVKIPNVHLMSNFISSIDEEEAMSFYSDAVKRDNDELSLPIYKTDSENGIDLVSHQDYMKESDDVRCAKNDRRIFTLMYTSGSTGKPKGAVITEQNQILDMLPRLESDPIIGISHLPAAWGTDRGLVWNTIVNGGRIGFSLPVPDLLENIKVLHPSMFASTPLILKMIFNQFYRELEFSGFSEDELLQQYSTVFGKRIKCLQTGGAATPPGVVSFMRKCLGCVVMDSYGATECGGITTNGRLASGVGAKLKDVPEMGYFTTDKPYPRGEILVKGDFIIPGYFRNAADSNARIDDDGWFHTGDICEFQGGSKVVVIDRIKNLFKLSNGEFVSPVKLEQIYQQSMLIDQIYIQGSSDADYVVAVVVCSYKDYEADHAQLKNDIIADMHFLAAENDLRKHEIPRDILLETVEWTVERGLLTPTYKLRRMALEQYYKKKIQELRLLIAQEEKEDFCFDSSKQMIANILGLCVSILNLPDESHVETSKSFRENGASSIDTTAFYLRILELLRGLNFPDSYVRSVPIAFIVDSSLIQLCTVLEQVRKKSMELGRAIGLQSHIISWNHHQLELLSEKMDRDSSLPDEMIEKIHLINAFSQTEENRDILLTGGTGFLGAHLLFDILDLTHAKDEKEDCHVTCLVRAESAEEGFQRLRRVLKMYDIWRDDFSHRIHAIPLRLNDELLGIPSDVYTSLQNRVGQIFHCAADTNSALPYESLREANVTFTLKMIEFAVSIPEKPKFLHHISTLSVFGSISRKHETVYEDTSIGNNAKDSGLLFADGYAISKWVSEQLVQEAAKAGLSAAIYRPGFISWSYRNGASNLTDWVTRLFRACLALKAVPLSKRSNTSKKVPKLARLQSIEKPLVNIEGINLIPVDYCSRAIVCTGMFLESVNAAQARVYHVNNNSFRGSISFEELYEWLSRCCSEIAQLSLSEWCDQVRSQHIDTFLPILHYIESGYALTEHFDDRNLVDALTQTEHMHGACSRAPAISEEKFRLHLEWLAGAV